MLPREGWQAGRGTCHAPPYSFFSLLLYLPDAGTQPHNSEFLCHSSIQPRHSQRLAVIPQPFSTVLKARLLITFVSICTSAAALHLTSQRSRSGTPPETLRPEEWGADEVLAVLPPAGPTAFAW